MKPIACILSIGLDSDDVWLENRLRRASDAFVSRKLRQKVQNASLLFLRDILLNLDISDTSNLLNQLIKGRETTDAPDRGTYS
jgi:hypothetical protein